MIHRIRLEKESALTFYPQSTRNNRNCRMFLLALFGGEWIWIMVIVGLTLFGSLLGTYGVYKFGTLEKYTDHFQRQNEDYGSELKRLKNVKRELKRSVHGIVKSVDKLKESTEEMNETLREFEGIWQNISGMCSDGGEMKEAG